jgi:hypothetical protein
MKEERIAPNEIRASIKRVVDEKKWDCPFSPIIINCTK